MSSYYADDDEDAHDAEADAEADADAAPPPRLRLAFAALSLGWLPAGAAAAAALRARREAFAAAHQLTAEDWPSIEDDEDEREPTEEDEAAMHAAEAEAFWQQLDELLTWH